MRVLVVDIDSCRPDHLGCYGYERDISPTIDRLAADGVRFGNCYASDTPCLPSRTALATCRFGAKNGVVTHWGPGQYYRDPGTNTDKDDGRVVRTSGPARATTRSATSSTTDSSTATGRCRCASRSAPASNSWSTGTTAASGKSTPRSRDWRGSARPSTDTRRRSAVRGSSVPLLAVVPGIVADHVASVVDVEPAAVVVAHAVKDSNPASDVHRQRSTVCAKSRRDCHVARTRATISSYASLSRSKSPRSTPSSAMQ